MEKKKHKIQSIGSVMQSSTFWERNTKRYITKEFQDYGYRLAMKLDDMERKSLYIKLARDENRAMLDRAVSFVSDYPNVKKKASVFMWKLKELKKERLEKQKEEKEKQVDMGI